MSKGNETLDLDTEKRLRKHGDQDGQRIKWRSSAHNAKSGGEGSEKNVAPVNDCSYPTRPLDTCLINELKM